MYGDICMKSNRKLCSSALGPNTPDANNMLRFIVDFMKHKHLRLTKQSHFFPQSWSLHTDLKAYY